MSKRFALTAAGVATAAVGSTAAAELISFTVHNDYYISENRWQLIDSNSNTIASMFVQGGYIYAGTSQSGTYPVSFGLWSTSAQLSGYLTTFQMDLAEGSYTVAMQDSWGDGWVWNDATGEDAFNVAGNLGNDETSVTFGMVGTAAVSGTFTVVPAPGALALLGLAGLSSRRKRK
ncbi:MAG: hypothetical protein CBC35_01650 [Planctomycetes bacterium TMED75]|nr:hypothetical protein [Planctomycetaceae bacterium]OUU96264.1 MAG: hypothetical protein CBC35_01650 [Planctomycetes bacterium TMED75]